MKVHVSQNDDISQYCIYDCIESIALTPDTTPTYCSEGRL